MMNKLIRKTTIGLINNIKTNNILGFNLNSVKFFGM